MATALLPFNFVSSDDEIEAFQNQRTIDVRSTSAQRIAQEQSKRFRYVVADWASLTMSFRLCNDIELIRRTWMWRARNCPVYPAWPSFRWSGNLQFAIIAIRECNFLGIQFVGCASESPVRSVIFWFWFYWPFKLYIYIYGVSVDRSIDYLSRKWSESWKQKIVKEIASGYKQWNSIFARANRKSILLALQSKRAPGRKGWAKMEMATKTKTSAIAEVHVHTQHTVALPREFSKSFSASFIVWVGNNVPNTHGRWCPWCTMHIRLCTECGIWSNALTNFSIWVLSWEVEAADGGQIGMKNIYESWARK